MFYQVYHAFEQALAPLRRAAEAAAHHLAQPWPGLGESGWPPSWPAALQMLAQAKLTHDRPDFGIDRVAIGNREVAVREEAAVATPFGTLIHFAKDIAATQPRVLIVAPLSGHFATLLRGTVRTMLPEHDVYITDWHDARDIPPSRGWFDLEDFITHVIGFIEHIGPGAHVVAICQPAVAALAAVAVMADAAAAAAPASLTLMAGPIDTRVNPTEVNRFATSRPIEWFALNTISPVPLQYAGFGRPVYPGVLQLCGFMSLNIERHAKAWRDMLEYLARGETEKAGAIRAFYDEYFAIMDMPAEFYLQTVRAIFQQHALPRGRMFYRGRRVEPHTISKTALLTIEGERDDICAVGQTLAAQELCSGLPPFMKTHWVQTGVGHYGVFSGRRWAAEVYPILRDVIHVND
ncbi:MAG TPA: polyhydroxyalkanoate depolymerase [Stellaceae bacterium]|nr:polyhydroxyalkanoate depolymerase [Stellaceae bacterium]